MTTLRNDNGYSSSLAPPPPSFRLVTVLSLSVLSLVCVVLAVMMIVFSNVNNDTTSTANVIADNMWLEMLYKLPLQLVIPSIVGGCVHWVALQLYLHN
jgi:hypothetical protein